MAEEITELRQEVRELRELLESYLAQQGLPSASDWVKCTCYSTSTVGCAVHGHPGWTTAIETLADLGGIK